MSTVIHTPESAYNEWRNTGPNGMGHFRAQSGWAGESNEAVLIKVSVDANGNTFVKVQAQRQIKRGPNTGKWNHEGRGDFHTKKDYDRFLSAVIEAGMRAGFLRTPGG